MGKEKEVGCARPTGGPVGEKVDPEPAQRLADKGAKEDDAAVDKAERHARTDINIH